MFGFRHWQTMHLLVAQSAAGYLDGLEHEDSPFNAIGDAGLGNVDELAKFGVPLLAHEQSHSWVGKYRRAAEMCSKTDYQGPERTSLLWVYEEGLSVRQGLLLATRAGFSDAAYARDNLANWAAAMAYSPGRASTPLVDTATQNWILRTVDNGWRSLRRSQDYYVESALIWLEADAIIGERVAGTLRSTISCVEERQYNLYNSHHSIYAPRLSARGMTVATAFFINSFHSWISIRVVCVRRKRPIAPAQLGRSRGSPADSRPVADR